MKELNALFAGEVSGHMFFADEFYGFDDAFYAAGRLLRILSNTQEKLSDIMSRIPSYPSTAETRVDCPDDVKFQVVERVKEEALKDHEAITVDGVRIIYPNGWGLVRASNTQPVIVTRCEGRTKEDLEIISQDMKRRLLNAGLHDFDWEY
jgi:phosphomannomutase/phosphoglucomutase